MTRFLQQINCLNKESSHKSAYKITNWIHTANTIQLKIIIFNVKMDPVSYLILFNKDLA